MSGDLVFLGSSRLPPDDPRWRSAPRGVPPWPLAVALLLLPLVVAWTLPQTLAGVVYAAYMRARGVPLFAYRFGPLLYLVVPAPPAGARGVSLGAVVFAEHPAILTHEFCHLYTAAWLGWLYLPVYGLEYLFLGHGRSPHERLTCWFERTTLRAWRKLL